MDFYLRWKWYKMKVLDEYITAPMSVSLDRVPFVDTILKRESVRRSPCLRYRPSDEKYFFDFVISNERSSQTIIKSKILHHLVLPVRNAR